MTDMNRESADATTSDLDSIRKFAVDGFQKLAAADSKDERQRIRRELVADLSRAAVGILKPVVVGILDPCDLYTSRVTALWEQFQELQRSESLSEGWKRGQKEPWRIYSFARSHKLNHSEVRKCLHGYLKPNSGTVGDVERELRKEIARLQGLHIVPLAFDPK